MNSLVRLFQPLMIRQIERNTMLPTTGTGCVVNEHGIHA